MSPTCGTLAERKRRDAMRRVQRVAVSAFAAEGFERVTVERLAADAEVSPISVYRWFGSKEGIVLWDDYDPALFEAIAIRLVDDPPLVAVRDAVITELDQVYDSDRELVLARTQLIHREPSLLSASMLAMRTMQAALDDLMADAVPDALPRAVLAATACAALVVAVDRWQELDGRMPLAQLVEESFAVLEGVRWS